MWSAIFVVPIIAVLQGVLIAGGVIFGNKLWALRVGLSKSKHN